MIGSLSNQKSLMTSRRRNAVTTISLVLIAYQVAPPGFDVSILLPGITARNGEYLVSFVGLSLILMSITYLFYLFAESIRTFGRSSQDPGLGDALRTVLISPLSFAKDFLIPFSLVVSAVLPIFQGVEDLSERIVAYIVSSFLSLRDGALGPESLKRSEELASIAAEKFFAGIELALYPIFEAMRFLSN